MESLYKVKILHYLNPHLIWSLTEKPGAKPDFVFEQIGIYGILPLNIDIDIDGNVATNRCKHWVPAVVVAMKKLLLEATEVWFSESFLENTTSIFDDNLHKYGDLKVKLKDGKTVSMRERLVDTGLVAEEEMFFQQNLQTKLEYVDTVAVFDKIKLSLKSLDVSQKKLESILMEKSTIYLKTVELEGVAGPRSMGLRQHHAKLIQKHIQNLSACKDIDEPSAGRASTVKSGRKLNSGLIQKLELVKNRSTGSEKSYHEDNDDSFKDNSMNIQQNSSDVQQKDTSSGNEDKNSTMDIQCSRENSLGTQDLSGEYLSRKKGEKSKQNKIKKEKKYVAYGPPGLKTSEFTVVEVTSPNEIPQKKSSSFEDAKIEEKSFVNGFENKCNIDEDNSAKKDIKISTETKECASQRSRKMQFLKQKVTKINDSSSTPDSDSFVKKGDDSDSESIMSLVEKIDLTSNIRKERRNETIHISNSTKCDVNPYKNLDGSQSVFVDKLIRPTLMVHTKKGNRIQPSTNMRDFPFATNSHLVLRDINVRKPMRQQTISWPTILRGHSLFLVSPSGSGKTIGYLPAVCQLVGDYKKYGEILSVNPLTCIILCATSQSISTVEDLCKCFLHDAKIFACYAGMTDVNISTLILNGCDILICSPSVLVGIIQRDLGLDLRNLKTFVIDDCERIADVYLSELKFCIRKVRDMLKAKANKEIQVQYVVASRIWCKFMSSLAKKTPDSIVCIGAFQECVLYSEANTSIEFFERENKTKLDSIVSFMNEIDKSKKTVIVCNSDDEVFLIKQLLCNLNYMVFACDNTMNVQELYRLDMALSEYKEPVLGPTLVCCDGNLNHLNVTDAHYLVHYSLPDLYSSFSKRFAVLIDNYASIFDGIKSDVRIKLFLDRSNVEQLPKILNFIKRSSENIPSTLDEISASVMLRKDLSKAELCVPLCNTLLTLGQCPDIWSCKHRHSIFQKYDEPKLWLPREGIVTFNILHYHSVVNYSARLLSCSTSTGVVNYPQTYSSLSIKMSMYYSKEKNRRLHGVPKLGDICAVASRSNLYSRCQVLKIVEYSNGIPTICMINLIDQEKYEMARDTTLYHLPDELKNIETSVARVILANISPQDKDITYSKLATKQILKITEKNDELLMRGRVRLVIGNCVFVDTLETCQQLSTLNETVVKNNVRNELLEGFAVNNPSHLETLEKLGENVKFMQRKENKVCYDVAPKVIHSLPKPAWAYLESDKHFPVYYLYAKTPEQFFVQHVKFQDCLNILIKDIDKYVSNKPDPVTLAHTGDIVLAEFPDNETYERARIDEIDKDSEKVKCFFVDLGDWRYVSRDKLLTISEKLITQLPFQAIECRLVGIKPLGNVWSEFSTNWFVDKFYDSSANFKYLFAKRHSKEKSEVTEGGKYAISLIDTYDNDVCINKLMLDANLADENGEMELFDVENFEVKDRESTDDNDSIEESTSITEVKKRNKDKNAEQSNSIELTKAGTESIIDIETSLSTSKDVDRSKMKNAQLNINSDTTKEIPSKNYFQEIQRAPSQNVSDSCTGSSDNIFTNEKPLMTFFKGNLLRSVPLVDDNDINDDRWEVGNPMLMLVGNDKSAKKPDPVKRESKVIPLAIEGTKHKDTKTEANKSDIIETNNDAIVSDISLKNIALNSNGVDHNSKINSDDVNSIDEEHNPDWSVLEGKNMILLYDNVCSEYKKLKLTWNQDNNSVMIIIEVATKNCDVLIRDKSLLFHTCVDGKEYGFDMALFAAAIEDESLHNNKGTHIEIYISKVQSRIWQNLYIGNIKKWKAADDKKSDDKSLLKSIEKASKEKYNHEQAKSFSALPETKIVNLRKPAVIWRQNENKITMKIKIIVDKYDVTISEKHFKFHAFANNDVEYGFDFELFGVVNVSKCVHSNKGLYIQIILMKIIARNWFALNKGGIHKWIVYDVDGINVSSDEENDDKPDDIAALRQTVEQESDSEVDFHDDTEYGGYKKDLL